MAHYKATIDPQVWINDHAVSVDAPGPTSWDCTAFVTDHKERPEGFEHIAQTAISARGHYLDRDDLLKGDPAAPEWVRDWAGPFTIIVEAAEHRPHAGNGNLESRDTGTAERIARLEEVLREFVQDIEVLGGVRTDHKGNPRPVGDPGWIDLGFTYLKACRVLGKEPVEADDEDETNSQDWSGYWHALASE